MPLTPGTRLGVYEVTALIGEGGMGQVYRARDTKLNRDVALKVLPDLFAANAERLARFTREAQTLASLNHPHIAGIYGLEESGGVRALVMELVEGEDLSQRIARGAVPTDEALPIARQIAEALEAAHEQGIVHRDLKPANIKVRRDGTVKVLDFGLAKAMEPTASSPNVTQSPTLTSPAMMTGMGVILGTAAYMSPEQAVGRPADKRSDVWAFGVVLLEMLTGRPVFAGETVSHVLAAVLKSAPDWTTLPADTPASIRTLLRRCLEKDRRHRLADAADARLEIEEALTAGSMVAASAAPVRHSRMPWLVAGLATIVAAAAVTLWAPWGTGPEPPRVSRLQITPADTDALTVASQTRDVAITPDGAHVIYAGVNNTLLVRPLDRLEPTSLTGLGGSPHGLFVSPDGQSIGFVLVGSSQNLKMVSISGGAPVTLATLDGSLSGATWGPDGAIVFGTTNGETGLQLRAPGDGQLSVLTRPNRAAGEADHVFPQFLPGGDAILFTIRATTGNLDEAQVALLDLRTKTWTTLIRGGLDAHYVRSGHLVYGSAGVLRAVTFDLARRSVGRTAVPIVSEVLTKETGAVQVAVAGDGTAVYIPGVLGTVPPQTLVWVDRQGREEAVTMEPRAYTNPRLSPDGLQVALDIRDQRNDIWILDLDRKALTRLTDDPLFDESPVWTPDGQHIVYSSGRSGVAVPNIYKKAVHVTGTAEPLNQSLSNQFPTAMSRDGHLVFNAAGVTGTDIMLLAPGAEGSVPLVHGAAVERNAAISPDGRWLAYESDVTGRAEIYVVPFPNVNGSLTPASTEGGTRPLWARSGPELFFVAPSGALMTVSIERGGARPKAGLPRKLFDWPSGRSYDVALDGRKFLMTKPVEQSNQTTAPKSLIVVQHFDEELKRLVPTN